MRPRGRRRPSFSDSARPETISHMRRHGFPRIMPSIKGKGSVMDGIEFLKSHEIIVHPRCIHLIDEFTLYGYKVDNLTGRVLPVLEDRDNHCIDALRYAVEVTRRATAVRVARDAMPLPVAHRW